MLSESQAFQAVSAPPKAHRSVPLALIAVIAVVSGLAVFLILFHRDRALPHAGIRQPGSRRSPTSCFLTRYTGARVSNRIVRITSFAPLCCIGRHRNARAQHQFTNEIVFASSPPRQENIPRTVSSRTFRTHYFVGGASPADPG